MKYLTIVTFIFVDIISEPEILCFAQTAVYVVHQAKHARMRAGLLPHFTGRLPAAGCHHAQH